MYVPTKTSFIFLGSEALFWAQIKVPCLSQVFKLFYLTLAYSQSLKDFVLLFLRKFIF